MNYTDKKEDTSKYPKMKKMEIKASARKPSVLQKFFDNFIRKDFAVMRDDFIEQFLIPQLQGMIIDGVNMWLQSLFDKPVSVSKIGNKKTDYHGISSKKSSGTTVSTSNGKNIYEVPELFVHDRSEALEVIAEAKKYLADYNAVPVDRFLDSLRITSDFVDTKWGFTSLDNVQIKPGRNDKGESGWIIILPEPEYLGK